MMFDKEFSKMSLSDKIGCDCHLKDHEKVVAIYHIKRAIKKLKEKINDYCNGTKEGEKPEKIGWSREFDINFAINEIFGKKLANG